jgi:acyl-CoA thioesterase I
LPSEKAMAMTDWANFVVGHFIGGWALFSGIALCLIGCVLKARFVKTRIQSFGRVLLLAGAVFVVLSAAPFSFWVYGVFFALLGLAAFVPTDRVRRGKNAMRLSFLLLLAQSSLMAWTEILHSLPPKTPLSSGATIFVLGDSLSIGADRPGKSWPELLGDLTGLKVRNFSFGGAKVESSLGSALRIDQEGALVMLEVGGNDLLGGTPIAKFREDLGKLLTLLCGPHRHVAMIELPLPPLYNRYGIVQRALAESHGVTLIPKRILAKVITTPGATVDGLHLSNTGHALLASALSQILAHPGPRTEAPQSN